MKKWFIIVLILSLVLALGEQLTEKEERVSVPLDPPSYEETVSASVDMPSFEETDAADTLPSVVMVEDYPVGSHRYTGEMANGVPQGFGTMFFDSGDRYEGVWDKGQMHGQGAMYWTNGDVYTGDFYFGARTGSGVYYWADGGIYEGEFREGMLYSFGVMHYADGSIFDGVWDHGTPAVGRFTEPNGESYEVEWVDGSLQRKDS